MSVDAIKGLITTTGFFLKMARIEFTVKVTLLIADTQFLLISMINQFIYDSEENPQNVAIKVWDRTTSNFSQAKNFVVLECVDRLLTQGYPPTCIELEKTYPSGRGHSGRLDILVKTANEVPFLMTEYEKEKGTVAKNGGQLFSYYSNDRDAQYLCLYTSRVETIAEYNHVIVNVEDAWHLMM